MPPAELSINNVSVTEGDSGTTNATFTVTLSSARHRHRDGRLRDRRRHRHRARRLHRHQRHAHLRPGHDHPDDHGRRSWATRSIEPDESFLVNLTNPPPTPRSPTRRASARSSTTVTVVPSVSINDVTVTEGDFGTTNATFTVTLVERRHRHRRRSTTRPPTAPPPRPPTTPPRAARSPSPRARSPRRSRSRSWATPLDERDETFLVNLTGSSANATIADARGWARSSTMTTLAAARRALDRQRVRHRGRPGTTDATFTVTLAAAATGP